MMYINNILVQIKVLYCTVCPCFSMSKRIGIRIIRKSTFFMVIYSLIGNAFIGIFNNQAIKKNLHYTAETPGGSVSLVFFRHIISEICTFYFAVLVYLIKYMTTRQIYPASLPIFWDVIIWSFCSEYQYFQIWTEVYSTNVKLIFINIVMFLVAIVTSHATLQKHKIRNKKEEVI